MSYVTAITEFNLEGEYLGVVKADKGIVWPAEGGISLRVGTLGGNGMLVLKPVLPLTHTG